MKMNTRSSNHSEELPSTAEAKESSPPTRGVEETKNTPPPNEQTTSSAAQQLDLSFQAMKARMTRIADHQLQRMEDGEIDQLSDQQNNMLQQLGQGVPGPSVRSASLLCAGESEEGRLPEMETPPDNPKNASPLDRNTRQPLLSRKTLLENAARVGASVLGVGVGSGGASRVAGLLAGVPIAAGGWGVGLGQGVQSAEAFGGPRRPLNRCLVIAVNAREFCKRLEADLAAGRNTQECRGMVKSVLRGLSLPESLKDAVLYLPGGKRQAATDAGQSAVEYLATVVEFDAWDKLDKDWTSNVALRNMTPDNIMFVRMALDASGSSLDVFLRQFNRADVDTAREVYREYFLPVEEQEPQQ